MARDPRVESAIAHWAPRFVANGVPLTDFQEVTSGLERWGDWCAAWCKRAAVHEAAGQDALADGFMLSAGAHLTTAALCYHFGKFVFVDDYEQMRAAHADAVRCRNLALPHLVPSGQRVELPYGDGRLIGNLRLPLSRSTELTGTPAPVVVMCMGLDSAKEEMHAYEALFLERGLATLAFDGPGQGEGEYDFAIRGDYEIAVGAVLDWLEARSEIDAARIGLWGVSLGGYYAPRAAAFQPRIKACIALSGPYDLGECWGQLPQLTRDTFRVRAKCDSEAQARNQAHTLSLRGVAGQIDCPLFIVAGKQDRLIPWQHAERLANEAAGKVELLMIEDGNHVANNRAYKYRTQSADWMKLQLGAPKL